MSLGDTRVAVTQPQLVPRNADTCFIDCVISLVFTTFPNKNYLIRSHLPSGKQVSVLCVQPGSLRASSSRGWPSVWFSEAKLQLAVQ
jgi:hypothetical protein